MRAKHFIYVKSYTEISVAFASNSVLYYAISSPILRRDDCLATPYTLSLKILTGS